MKDWDEYNTKLPYPQDGPIRERMQSELDALPLTKAERLERERKLKRELSAAMIKAREPYNEDQRRLEAMFWDDCRNDLGYADILTEDGMNIIESQAYQEGHSGGYSEIYSHLCDLSQLVVAIRKHFKE